MLGVFLTESGQECFPFFLQPFLPNLSRETFNFTSLTNGMSVGLAHIGFWLWMAEEFALLPGLAFLYLRGLRSTLYPPPGSLLKTVQRGDH